MKQKLVTDKYAPDQSPRNAAGASAVQGSSSRRRSADGPPRGGELDVKREVIYHRDLERPPLRGPSFYKLTYSYLALLT